MRRARRRGGASPLCRGTPRQPRLPRHTACSARTPRTPCPRPPGTPPCGALRKSRAGIAGTRFSTAWRCGSRTSAPRRNTSTQLRARAAPNRRRAASRATRGATGAPPTRRTRPCRHAGSRPCDDYSIMRLRPFQFGRVCRQSSKRSRSHPALRPSARRRMSMRRPSIEWFANRRLSTSNISPTS